MPSRLLYCLALVALTSCSSTSAPVPCHGDLVVSVIRGPVPRFTWLPGCSATSLSVAEAVNTPGGQPKLMWAFTDPYGFVPAIQYSAAPPHADVWVAPAALTSGTTYRVTVEYVLGGDVLTSSGETTFTW
jgi:hypothetical protein